MSFLFKNYLRKKILKFNGDYYAKDSIAIIKKVVKRNYQRSFDKE